MKESVQICEMLFSTSFVAIVCGNDVISNNNNNNKGVASRGARRKLRIIDLRKGLLICELSFVTPVLSVFINMRRMAVVMETKIHLYEVGTAKMLETIDTCLNSNGIAALSPNEHNCWLAYPYVEDKGTIAIHDALNLALIRVINAHKSPISKICFDCTGDLLATASTKGTVIRVFDEMPDPGDSGSGYSHPIEFRRGTMPANICSVSFSSDSSILCVSSDTGTVHLFNVYSEVCKRKKNNQGAQQTTGQKATPNHPSPSNHQSQQTTSGISQYLPNVFRSGTGSGVISEMSTALGDMWDSSAGKRSFCTVQLPPGVRTLCSAVSANPSGNNDEDYPSPQSLRVVTEDGDFLEYGVDPNRVSSTASGPATELAVLKESHIVERLSDSPILQDE